MSLYSYQKIEPSLNGWEYLFTFLIGFLISIIVFYIAKRTYLNVKATMGTHGIMSSLYPAFHGTARFSNTIPVSVIVGLIGGLFCLVSLMLSNLILYYLKDYQTRG
jgi:hypothetical protein